MAEKHEIDITIDDDGNVSFEVKGVKGKRCHEITKELVEALGVVIKSENTSEFYQTDTQQQSYVEQQGG
ncbi:DUF2997 domain-containing protein [Planctomycetota bacterium]